MFPHRALVVPVLMACVFGPVRYARARSPQQAPCVDPTPRDSAWWHFTWTRNPDGSSTGTVPDAPAQAKDLVPARWTGSYSLIFVHTVGPDRGDTTRALVEFFDRRDGEDSTQTGIANPVTKWPRYFSFAPDSRPDTRQPVDVLYDAVRGDLSFVIGNKGLRWTDSGVILDVFTMSPDRFVGRWVDGGLIVFGSPSGSHPQGYFCLERRS
jgi:hypothetical protein